LPEGEWGEGVVGAGEVGEGAEVGDELVEGEEVSVGAEDSRVETRHYFFFVHEPVEEVDGVVEVAFVDGHLDVVGERHDFVDDCFFEGVAFELGVGERKAVDEHLGEIANAHFSVVVHC